MATIVRYGEPKRSVNAYPRMFISAEQPSARCNTDMVQIGGLEAEDERLLYCKRCRSCGFTVRYFLPCPGEMRLKCIPEVDELSKLATRASYCPYLE